MNIGNTPQAQYATIRYIYKRVLIVGAIISIFMAFTLISNVSKMGTPKIGMGLSFSQPIAPKQPSFLDYILAILTALGTGMFCGLTYTWAFYWIKGKLSPGSIAAIGASIANTANSGNTYEVYRDSITGDVTITKKVNWIPIVLAFFCLFYIFCIIGLFYAIKFAIVGLRLKKQLNIA